MVYIMLEIDPDDGANIEGVFESLAGIKKHAHEVADDLDLSSEHGGPAEEAIDEWDGVESLEIWDEDQRAVWKLVRGHEVSA